ncbi:uncharacterized protein [Drosophila pseudoobscura]|uniref:Uncharacterized protein n=1 Tax=Drosophila pseudoobscura pseudoobscura TaxID=46245 RepID=A0A6I8UZV3_DROPS|nr:uncharacterized protein LOC6902284 [Drosophila pseudoobscura]
MSKLCILLGLVVLVGAIGVDGNNRRPPCAGRCTQKDLLSSRTVCVRDSRTNTCTRLLPCRLREKNCSRRDNGLEPVKQTCVTRCRNIVGGSGASGRCALRLRTPAPVSADGKRVRECQQRWCLEDKVASCWKNRQGGCSVQSRCEARRRNCSRKPGNQWISTEQWRCRGITQGESGRRCRTRPIINKY